MPVRPAEFREAMSGFPNGVTIVTSVDSAGRPVGMTVSAFAALSLDPPLVLVNLQVNSRTLAAIRHHRSFTVHLLDSRHVELARRFAENSESKFQGTNYAVDHSGLPYLTDCPARLQCTMEAEYPGGDHFILVGRVMQSHSPEERADLEPLVYFRRAFIAVGKQHSSGTPPALPPLK
jgi:flavin reductase (DIM6/NTAB) family NADH-FMN oxidoreductase RutF